MISQFKHIGIVTRPQTPKIEAVLHELIEFLCVQKLQIYLDDASVADGIITAADQARCAIVNKDTLGKSCDLVIVLGGDGTFLSVARKLAPYRVPMIGVNQGHLGFLTQVPREQMVNELTGMLTGKYLPEERILLETSVWRDGETVQTSLALNDVVLSRGGEAGGKVP